MNRNGRIVCAAIKAEDGDLLLGIRHYSNDMVEQIDNRTDGYKFYHRNGDDQGFVDQDGVYLTRDEAYIVAKEAGQIVYDLGFSNNKLYSEHLY